MIISSGTRMNDDSSVGKSLHCMSIILFNASSRDFPTELCYISSVGSLVCW